MRFNPKADISSGRVRDAGGSGGGGGLGNALGNGRLPIPSGGKGGIGSIVAVLVVVAIAYFSGGLNTLTGGGGSEPDTTRYDSCRTGADANSSEDCRRKGVEVSLSNYWETALPQQSSAGFRDTSITTFTGNISTGGCGSASSAVGPFYCPADMTIYLDSTFFPQVLEQQLGGRGGDFVEPYVLAHEYGHHIQNLMGTMNKVRTQQGPKSDAVRLELQADCYAGMWARSASQVPDDNGQVLLEELSRSDINEALDSAKAVGDDRIQERSSGRVNPEQWTHGSAEQRQRWFMTGYESGSLEACDTFSARNL